MLDYGIHHVTVYVPDGACPGVEVGGDRSREGRPSCEDEFSRGGVAHGQEVGDGFRTGDPWGRVVDYVVGARQ